MRLPALSGLLLLLLAPCGLAGADVSRNVSLSLTVQAQCGITTVSQQFDTNAGGSLSFRYLARTSTATGGGSIAVALAPVRLEDYSPDTRIAFETSLGGPGSAVSGSTPLADALASGLVVASLPADAHTPRAGSSASVRITLVPAPAASAPPLTAGASIQCR